MERILSERRARALLIYPTKALAQDQLRALGRLKQADGRIRFQAGCYDGDTPPELRRRLRDEANIILTNPDMLHQGILPNHSRWSEFFSNLEFVVLDEVHTYRGVFGSNVANVVRRLRRIARHYGSSPTFICCSATIANPKEHSERITGVTNVLISNDGAPHGEKLFVLFNPDFIDEAQLARRGPFGVARKLMAQLVSEGVQTITFSRTRLGAEIIYRYCQETLARRSQSLARLVKAYRGGYLPGQRRQIERGLAEGSILGVCSTNALELGIDIGGLDSALIVSYPGTIASLWQQAGRAGRGDSTSLVVLIAQNSPIDQFLMNNPEYLFKQTPEQAIVDPDNPHIAIFHLRCALRELPLGPSEAELFGQYTAAMLKMLQEQKQAHKIGGMWYWASDAYPAAEFGLRQMGTDIYTIMDAARGNEVIGTIDASSAFVQTHKGAVYLHDAETHIVLDLDIEKRIVEVQRKDLDYYTQAIIQSSILVSECEEHRRWLENSVNFGDVTVTTVIPMFKKIKFYNRESIGFEKLDLPPQHLETVATWLVPSAEALASVARWGSSAAEALAGIANVLVDIASLHLMCEQIDIGTVVDSSNTGSPALFVYDRYPYGIGYAARLFRVMERVMRDTLKAIKSCGCQQGCPSCVGSPLPAFAQIGADETTRGIIPDKEAAIVLLHAMLGLEPYKPRFIRPAKPKQDQQAAAGQASEPERLFKPLPARTEERIRRRIQKLSDKNIR